MRRITKLGGFLVGIGAGAAAIIWMVKDRLLGPEAAPVTVETAPAFRVAPGPPQVPEAGSDDLTAVKGIGPVYRARLEEAGISSFDRLASSSSDDVSAAAGVDPERAADWIDQAHNLTAG